MLYSDRLFELGEGEEENARINSTRLKEKLLAAVPVLEENKKGKTHFCPSILQKSYLQQVRKIVTEMH